MTRPFSSATAEQVIAAVEAVVVNRQSTSIEFVADFLDVPKDQAEAALRLAADLGFLSENAEQFSVASPLCIFLVTPNQMQKAAVLRVVLESYEPFIIFRERLVATGLAATAGQQTKVALDLAAHRVGIKDTLISLGTYRHAFSHALVTEGGGRYRPEEEFSENPLETMAQACSDATAAEGRIREQLGPDAAVLVSREEVIIPLADAFLRAKAGDSRGAVVAGGNAVESYLDALASRVGINLTGATGINAKLDRLSQGKNLPKKLGQVGKYLGHVRNAADQGVDPDVGASWAIREATGLEYVYIACSFLAATTASERGKPPEIQLKTPSKIFKHNKKQTYK